MNKSVSLNRPFQKETPLLFFDSAANGGEKYSYLFTKPLKVLRALEPGQVEGLLAQVDEYSKKYWVCGYLAYEASFGLEPELRELKPRGNKVFGWFGVFEKPSARAFPAGLGSYVPVEVAKTLTKKTFLNAFKKIKSAISKGFTYQVNYSYDTYVKASASPHELYSFLRLKQPTDYCCFIKHDDTHILSFSPELFFETSGSAITLKPMKGTSFPGDLGLSSDAKNRAENIMIVDLIRNDIGRICTPKSVKVEKLFEVEHHPTLSQMTSTISGRLKTGTKFSDIVKAVFPSGSVTGAPKIETMKIINRIESGHRGVYCGMIGFASPERTVFSVPIRTLIKKGFGKTWRYRSGSGITWPSNARDEFDECRRKFLFLQGAQKPEFEIFESLLWKGEPVYWKEHMDRLKRSAVKLGFRFNAGELETLKDRIGRRVKSKKSKVRIFLNSSGELRWDYERIGDAEQPGLISFAVKPIEKDNELLAHKTTYRPWYKNASKEIRKGGLFDLIFCNERGEVTEGARSNVFIKKRGKLYTPPASCGLLPGVLRQRLIGQKKCAEKVLRKKDLLSADEIYCGNSVRGLVRVRI